MLLADPRMQRLPGSGSGRKRPLSSPTTPNELNDHIYELYKPSGEPSMDILFFHGLQFEHNADAYWSTWTCRDDSEKIWPSTWLVEEFPNAHIFSISYDACMTTTEQHGRFDLFMVAENLIQAICWADIGQGLGRPVVLVGHSFGGLVIKKVCVNADRTRGLGPPESDRTRRIGMFLDNIAGVFYFGTPHRGSPLADKASHFLTGPLLVYVESLSTESARLDDFFDHVRKKYRTWHIAGVGESRPTLWGTFRDIVVPEASARCENFCTAAADHITLCKPASKTSTNFQHLKQFLMGIQRKGEPSFDNMQRTPELLVGLDSAVKEVQEMLRGNQKVGIVGMGGVGKTTLAMVLFNKLAPTFDYSCFFPVVKSIPGSVEDVKKELWGSLHCHGKKVDENYSQGCWSKLTRKRLLLVLDVIMSSARDLHVLSDIAHDIGQGVAGPHSGAAGLRYIVTSRDADLLNDMDEIYHVSFLVYTDALQLFMRYAFPRQTVAPNALQTSVKAIVEKCDGLPLTLELLGKYLHRKKDKQVWLQILENLDKAEGITQRDERLWQQLMPSYKDLREEEQEMFLDITTFFSSTADWTLFEAKAAWRVIYGSESVRWQTLLDRSLVLDVKEDENIRVHEQLQSLGRKLASQSKKCRIWNDTEALRLLQSTDESDDQIHALRLEPPLQVCGDPFSMDIHIARSVFYRLKVVRYLHLSTHMNVEENVTWVHDHLALLRCTGRQFFLLFNHIRLTCLSILEIIFSDIGHLPGSIGQLLALRILKLSGLNLGPTLPDEIGQLRALERVHITECRSLYTLPESFGHLPALEYLQFSECGLRSLPESFGSLRSLKYLIFKFCLRMRHLPESFRHLGSLEKLEFSSCGNLPNLPESFGQLSTLKQLQFSYVNVRSLPKSFGGLCKLKHLQFCLVNLHSLPESFGCLSALEDLKLLNLLYLESLPVSFGRLSGLQFLEIVDCPKLNDLPEFFGQLAKLQRLNIDNCPNLERLPTSFAELKDLRHLSIRYIPLTSIPDFIKALPSLERLHLGVLPYIKELPPWLPETTVTLSPTKLAQRIYHVENGHFTLAKAEDFDTHNEYHMLSHWLTRKVVEKLRTLCYGEALALLESSIDLRLQVGALTRDSDDWIRNLQARSILKRLTGDLDGPSADLDAAMQKGFENNCRKHRGYVKYLLGDMEGAGKDGEKAFAYQCTTIMDTCVSEDRLGRLEDKNVETGYCDYGYSEVEVFLEDQRTPYLDFAFVQMWKSPKVVENVQTWTGGVTSQAMEKMMISNFAGALADLDDVNATPLGFRAQAYILQAKGILKRLTGDLRGALDDLTSALETFPCRDEFAVEGSFEEDDNFQLTRGYESWKVRGYIRYLLLGAEQLYWFEEEEFCSGLVSGQFSGFRLAFM